MLMRDKSTCRIEQLHQIYNNSELNQLIIRILIFMFAFNFLQKVNEYVLMWFKLTQIQIPHLGGY